MARSILTITAAADDLQLLSIEEMREAAGVTGTAHDISLQALGLRVAAAIMTECNIAVGSGGEPTLRRETLTESLRGVRGEQLILARRHEVAIASVVEDDVALDAAFYEVDPESGLVTRLSGTCTTRWCSGKVVVVYNAGFTTVPGDLKQAAIETFRAFWMESGRDPFVKATTIEIPDVETVRTELWAGSLPGQADGGAVPAAVLGSLKRFQNTRIA